ncbi:MAG: SRPBCC family protein [Verrucomicrobiota bacterium]
MPTLKVNRSIVTACSVDQVYGILRNFTKWPEWSPWLVSEPDCQLNFAEDGLSYAWNGQIIGSGRMKLLNEVENVSITYELALFKPWKSVSTVRFELSHHPDGTEVNWMMDGSLPIFMFWMKPMMLAYIGSDYERGLLMLKELAEASRVSSKLDFIGIEETPEQLYVGVQASCSVRRVSEQMEADFKKLGRYIEDQELTTIGAPFTVYHKWDLVRSHCDYMLAFPISKLPSILAPGFVSGSQGGGEVYSIRHTGPYHYLPNAWSAAYMRANAKTFKPKKGLDPFETYENDPADVPEAELVTTIRFPVR